MMDDPDRNRLAIFPVTKEALLDWFKANTSLGTEFPGADVLAVHYDFHSDTFLFKFRHPSLPSLTMMDGEPIPRIELVVSGRPS